MKKRYNINKAAKVGEIISCPSCGFKFKKGSYQQVFCKTKGGTKCKDKYWNTVDPNKRNNTTRISPANAAWLLANNSLGKEPHFNDIYNDFHPFEGLNDEDYKNH